MFSFTCLILPIWHDFLCLFLILQWGVLSVFLWNYSGRKLFIDTFFLFSFSWLASFMAFAASFMFFTSFESTASCMQSSFGKVLMVFQFFADSQHFIVWMALRDSMFNLFVVSSMTLPIILKLLSTTGHKKYDKSAKTILHIFGYLSNRCTSIHHLLILFASPLTSKTEASYHLHYRCTLLPKFIYLFIYLYFIYSWQSLIIHYNR